MFGRRLSVLGVVLAACAAPTRGDDAITATAVSTLPHVNPVLTEDCPDPGVLREDDAGGPIYTMVCTTNSPDDVFRIYRSKDLVSWEKTNDFVFPGHPRHPWANDNFWAPEIHRMPDSAPAASRYVVYYTARSARTGKLCIGTATAASALGPYTESATPIVCHDDFGVIDATYFLDDDGTAYLYWKDDGNDPDPGIQRALKGHTVIHGQRLTADGLQLDASAPAALVDHDLDWEGNLVEAPWMTKRDGFYYLFYSAFSYCDARYAVGVARATSPLGPFTKHPTLDPILSSGGAFDGPGHGSVVMGPANDAFYFVYHAWTSGTTCSDPGAARHVLVDRVDWGYPRVNGQLVHESWPRIGDGHPSH